MVIPTLSVQYSNIDGSGDGSNQWSVDDAVSCQALPAGAPSYGNNITAGGLTFNTNADLASPVVCPIKCTPDYASCASLARHFFDSYLFHSTHITGQPYVLPLGPLNQVCWDSMPDVSRFQSAVGYFQQPDLSTDWAFGRVAKVEFYCTTDGKVALTAIVPEGSANGLHYTYTNAKRRVLLKLMSSSDYDASLGIGFTCTHCMYFMLEGVSAQPFAVMLVGSVKGLLLCYLFYFVGRLAGKKKRQRMAYVVTRGDLLDRLEAVKWILGIRRKELRASRGQQKLQQNTIACEQGGSSLEEYAAFLRGREHSAIDDGLFAMSTVDLVAEKRHIRECIHRVELAYSGKQNHSSRLSRFLHRLVPNPIDLVIFLMLRLLSLKKHDDVIRVRKAIARTFSSATLSRTELAAHLGVVLTNSQYPLSHVPLYSPPTWATPPTAFPPKGALSAQQPASNQLTDRLLASTHVASVAEVGEADQRWYAFARYFAEHLTSVGQVWLVKHTLDTPPPLQSEKATMQQNAELRHTHLLLHATYLLYCSLMDRVGAPPSSGMSPNPQGMPIPSRRRNASNLQLLNGDSSTPRREEDTRNGEEGSGLGATISVDAAVAFLRQEVTAYAKEWVQLGCLNLPQHPTTCEPPSKRGSPLRSPISPNSQVAPFHSTTVASYKTAQQDSDFSDVEDTKCHASIAEAVAGLAHLSRAEKSLQFQMDTLLMLRAHVSDVSFTEEADAGARCVTKVRFASRLEAFTTPEHQSDLEDGEVPDPNTTEAHNLTSSNFVKSVHVAGWWGR